MELTGSENFTAYLCYNKSATREESDVFIFSTKEPGPNYVLTRTKVKKEDKNEGVEDGKSGAECKSNEGPIKTEDKISDKGKEGDYVIKTEIVDANFLKVCEKIRIFNFRQSYIIEKKNYLMGDYTIEFGTIYKQSQKSKAVKFISVYTPFSYTYFHSVEFIIQIIIEMFDKELNAHMSDLDGFKEHPKDVFKTEQEINEAKKILALSCSNCTKELLMKYSLLDRNNIETIDCYQYERTCTVGLVQFVEYIINL